MKILSSILLFLLAAGPVAAQTPDADDLNQVQARARGTLGQKGYRPPDGIDLRLEFPDRPDSAGVFSITAKVTSNLFALKNTVLKFNVSEGLDFVGKQPEWKGDLEVGKPVSLAARIHYISAKPEESLGVQIEFDIPAADMKNHVQKNAEKQYPVDELRRMLLDNLERAGGTRGRKWKAALLANPDPRAQTGDDR